MRRLLLLALCIFAFSAYVSLPFGPPPVLPSYNNVAANWKNAGLAKVGTIASIDAARTNCTTGQAGLTMPLAPSGLTPPVANDDAANINLAITNCPSGTIVRLSSGTFQISQSENIALNKSITLRGSDSCTSNSSSPYCGTVINVRDGAVADWLISSSTAGAQCGTDAAHLVSCSAASGVILMSANGVYNWGWGGCTLGSAVTSCGVTLATDAAAGATTVQVSDTSNFSSGMWVLIDEDPAAIAITSPIGGANFNGSPELLNSSGSPNVMRVAIIDTVNTYSMATSRLAQEIHKISSIGAGPCPGVNCTLTFDDPLTMGYRQSGSHNAKVFWPTSCCSSTYTPFLEKAGVENLTITKAANSGIQLTFCAYCWVNNVEVYNWIAGAANVIYSVRDQLEFNYFHDCTDCENNGNEYPIGIDSASTETLLVNSILVHGGKGMVGRASNTAVVAYNYVDNTFYMSAVIGDYWLDMGLNGSHFGGTHHWLFEGNYSDNCDGDEIHGNSIYHVFFRNQCAGLRESFVDPSCNKTVNDAAVIGYAQGDCTTNQTPGPLRAAGPGGLAYWYAYIGNVLGLSGVTTSGNGWVYGGAFCGGCSSNPLATTKSIWFSGWVGGEGTAVDPNLVYTNSSAYIFRHGNYDYVTAGIADWSSGYTRTLPNSLYLYSAPSFFSAGASCTYSWPWVTPTSSPYIQANSCSGPGLPAKARFDAGTPFVQP